MAPEWAKAVQPLVLVFGSIAFLVTILFEADVDAQGGAYATGVLVLMTSAAVAVTLSARRRRQKLTSAIEVSHLPDHYEALFLEVIGKCCGRPSLMSPNVRGYTWGEWTRLTPSDACTERRPAVGSTHGEIL
jgi:hypothetical protein